jgi:hypothetical protein
VVVEQRQMRGRGVAGAVDAPLVLLQALGDGLRQHVVVLDQQDIHGSTS